MVRSENHLFDAVTRAVGSESPWTALLRDALGLENPAMDAQIRSALRLYVQTAELLVPAMTGEHAVMVRHVCQSIASVITCGQ